MRTSAWMKHCHRAVPWYWNIRVITFWRGITVLWPSSSISSWTKRPFAYSLNLLICQFRPYRPLCSFVMAVFLVQVLCLVHHYSLRVNGVFKTVSKLFSFSFFFLLLLGAVGHQSDRSPLLKVYHRTLSEETWKLSTFTTLQTST